MRSSPPRLGCSGPSSSQPPEGTHQGAGGCRTDPGVGRRVNLESSKAHSACKILCQFQPLERAQRSLQCHQHQHRGGFLKMPFLALPRILASVVVSVRAQHSQAPGRVLLGVQPKNLRAACLPILFPSASGQVGQALLAQAHAAPAEGGSERGQLGNQVA